MRTTFETIKISLTKAEIANWAASYPQREVVKEIALMPMARASVARRSIAIEADSNRNSLNRFTDPVHFEPIKENSP
jgi:hypothetical protein